ncbi:hypothetical protein [Kineosporia sp. NBRC 101731]|uniref:hypothetical protein n=1 Tax=Kineosporia sp. NBRC 101731 TaxID=3032199 RepID=UPI0024A38A2D|nr:hypothetical protein [Kineosporia sp. NBRC 101731]GLY27032.1 hypothetical protein Kisp02_03970 [Kineosporia sp. NBRC 101731]
MNTRSKAMAFAGFGLAAAVGITGCGSGSDSADGETGSGSNSGGSPKEKVAAAFQSLNSSSNVGFTLKLDSSTADLEKISAAQDSTEQLDAEDKKTIGYLLKGSVTMNVSAPEGKTFADVTTSSAATKSDNLLKDPAAFEAALKDSGSVATSVVYDGSGLVDFVSKDGVFYLRADADKIATLSGQNLSSLTGTLGQLPPVIATPAQKLFDGQWVSLDLVKTVQILDKQGLLDELSKSQDTTAADAVDPAKVQSLITSLQASYDSDSEVTEVDGGYQVSVPYEKTADAVNDDLVALIGADEVADFRKELKQAPNKNLVFTVKVDDDKLSGVNIDLQQFMTKPVEGATFAVDLAVDTGASAVQVPTGATAVDIQGLFNLIPADSLAGLAQGSGL